MQRNRHIRRARSDALINQPDIVLRQLVGIDASAAQMRPVFAAAKCAPRGIIQLQIPAAGIIEGLYRIPVHPDDISIQRCGIRVDLVSVIILHEMKQRR